MIEEQKKQFFAMKSGIPHTVKVGGKFSFASLSKDIQGTIKKRLVEKDKVMVKSIKEEILGIKINGKLVTKENLHELELMTKEDKKINKKIFTKEDLKKLSFNELKKIGKKFGTTDRSKTNLIKEIIKLQN